MKLPKIIRTHKIIAATLLVSGFGLTSIAFAKPFATNVLGFTSPAPRASNVDPNPSPSPSPSAAPVVDNTTTTPQVQSATPAPQANDTVATPADTPAPADTTAPVATPTPAPSTQPTLPAPEVNVEQPGPYHN